MLMYKPEGGFHNFGDHEIEQAKKDGWVDGAPVRAALMTKKGKPVAAEPATIEAQPVKRAGRPRKELPSFLSGAVHGNSTDDN
jgi:hypothetical protein